MSERKEMSTETRSLIAAVLCLVVIGGWSLIYKPPAQPPFPIAPNPAPTLPAAPAQSRFSGGIPSRLRPRPYTLPCTLQARSTAW